MQFFRLWEGAGEPSRQNNALMGFSLSAHLHLSSAKVSSPQVLSKKNLSLSKKKSLHVVRLCGCVMCSVRLLQETLDRKSFGEDLPSVVNEVEEHNIFQSEVEALVPHLPKTGDKVRRQRR